MKSSGTKITARGANGHCVGVDITGPSGKVEEVLKGLEKLQQELGS